MKLVKVGQVWFSSYDGQLKVSSALLEDPEKWQPVKSLTQAQAHALANEFPAEIEAIASTAAEEHVVPAALEDAVNVAKFDSWHAVAAKEDDA